jgi:hypothetical protein
MGMMGILNSVYLLGGRAISISVLCFPSIEGIAFAVEKGWARLKAT